MRVPAVVSLGDLVADPACAATLPYEQREAMLRQIAAVLVALSIAPTTEPTLGTNGTDELIDVPEACRLLNVDAPWLWRRSRRVDMRGVVIKLSRKRMMFRRGALLTWIARQGVRP